MNKQEAIEKIKGKTEYFKVKKEYNRGFRDGLNSSIPVIREIDEPEKPVVPQFVANFYESIKDDIENEIYDLCVEFRNGESKLDKDILFWFDNSKNEPIQTLVKMKLYSYEVEKEKLYTVEMPNPNGFIRLVLCKDCDGKLFVATFSGGDCWETFGKCKLTEAEIKEDFEWAWQFAEEVKE